MSNHSDIYVQAVPTCVVCKEKIFDMVLPVKNVNSEIKFICLRCLPLMLKSSRLFMEVPDESNVMQHKD